MDRGYDLYCLADPIFYDSAMSQAVRDDTVFAAGARPLPEGWRTSAAGDWLMHAPADACLPPQGWKIHASACLDNADAVLDVIWQHCVECRVAFKHIRTRDLLLLRNVKYAHRGTSGKFVTIFPADETELEDLLTRLGAALDGEAGPYILSDLRWGSGPLFVRYGGFADRWCVGPDGELTPAIEDGDGRLVPDDRGAVFRVPPWVALPAFLEPHLAARNSATVDDMPYRVEEALHFSNGGGVYLARHHATGEMVVLKEARPHAGLALDGSDAVARLAQEREMLERLAGTGVVPAVRDGFVAGEHHFLALEHVDAPALGPLIVDRHPLVRVGADDAALAAFTAWAVDVHGQLERAVAAAHARGVVVGDLHPSNVLVHPDGGVTLIDLETASLAEDDRAPTLADPHFAAPPGVRGADVDRYALACLRLFMFLPLTALVRQDPGKAVELAEEIARIFPVPRAFLAAGVEVLERAADRPAARPPAVRPAPSPEAWPALRDSLARAIRASATPERDDRLFPGDPRQFDTGGLDLAYGAAGVLHALHATGAGRRTEHEEWLVRRALAPEPGVRLGFYDGLLGVAYALERLGRRDDAVAVLDLCRGELDGHLDAFGADLVGGLSGIGLGLAHFASVTGDRTLWEEALGIADVLADRLAAGEDGEILAGRLAVAEAGESSGEGGWAGLTRGASGPALFFLRLHDAFGAPDLLDLAATALRHDLRRCLLQDDGTLAVNEGWRTMPYLADGSAGIGLVLDAYLARAEDADLADAAARIRRIQEIPFLIESGLFWGRAGILLASVRARGREDPVVADHVRRLAFHALAYDGELAFPGEQLLRLSMDLATGTAGVLLALGAVLHDAPVGLPFLVADAPTGADDTPSRHDVITERR